MLNRKRIWVLQNRSLNMENSKNMWTTVQSKPNKPDRVRSASSACSTGRLKSGAAHLGCYIADQSQDK